MDRNECDWYEPITKKNKVCKHFLGNVNSKRDIGRCRYNCSVHLMKEDRSIDIRKIRE
ncbi:hypothetical protein [Clostridium sp. YIM B02551]|uniref:hypothetical protein n=1 Tax=Clostridium sp. YIM B02551 TaxID=2910679 RepID=UPI001EEC0B7B|nr:hypothetical protein [Clostridium sp. YIM B02551]